MILHLGVIDIPYATYVRPDQRRVAVRRKKGGPARIINAAPRGGETTGDVAEILEDKYHIMEFFFEDIGSDLIAAALEHSMSGAIENLVAGASVGNFDPTDQAMSEIKGAFDAFITQQEMDGQQPGVPTKASLRGVNHRFKHPYAKGNAPRPSFRDTGEYLSSFKAWVES